MVDPLQWWGALTQQFTQLVVAANVDPRAEVSAGHAACHGDRLLQRRGDAPDQHHSGHPRNEQRDHQHRAHQVAEAGNLALHERVVLLAALRQVRQQLHRGFGTHAIAGVDPGDQHLLSVVPLAGPHGIGRVGHALDSEPAALLVPRVGQPSFLGGSNRGVVLLPKLLDAARGLRDDAPVHIERMVVQLGPVKARVVLKRLQDLAAVGLHEELDLRERVF